MIDKVKLKELLKEHNKHIPDKLLDKFVEQWTSFKPSEPIKDGQLKLGEKTYNLKYIPPSENVYGLTLFQHAKFGDEDVTLFRRVKDGKMIAKIKEHFYLVCDGNRGDII